MVAARFAGGARRAWRSNQVLLLTRVRGRWILGSWYAGCRIVPLAGHSMVGPRLLGSSRSTTIYRTGRMMCSGQYA